MFQTILLTLTQAEGPRGGVKKALTIGTLTESFKVGGLETQQCRAYLTYILFVQTI